MTISPWAIVFAGRGPFDLLKCCFKLGMTSAAVQVELSAAELWPEVGDGVTG